MLPQEKSGEGYIGTHTQLFATFCKCASISKLKFFKVKEYV
jgi:hypothetical protein